MWYTNYRMEKREKMMIKIGTRLKFNYGAMIPEGYGVITAILRAPGIAIDCTTPLVATVALEDGESNSVKEYVELDHIRTPGETSVNGSPIGVYIDEIGV